MRLFLAIVALLTALSACKDEKDPARPKSSKPKGANAGAKIKGVKQWKGILMTGDDSIDAFDNARTKLKDLWIARGIKEDDIRELSMEEGSSSAAKLTDALEDLALGPNDGCLLHLTSHGSPWGFYMRGQDALTPFALDKIVEKACGHRPTVLMVSACYSGVFTQNVLRRKNRILFSAARDDRNSFGCGVENEFTFWDGCVIEHLPTAKSWVALQKKIVSCIRTKERAEGVRFSYPQVHIGESMKSVGVFGKAGQ